MPEFFVPAAESPEQAEEVWQATKTFAEEQLGWAVTDRRIFRVEFVHDGEEFAAEVGRPGPQTGEIVLVILESNSYLVCTENRGVARGSPIMVGIPREIADFN